MGYEDNQKSEYQQKCEGRVRYVTGLWEKKNGALKSGRINTVGWMNLQAFGPDTILIIKKKKRRKQGGPQYVVYACKDFATSELSEIEEYFEYLEKKKKPKPSFSKKV